jgi:hypothetical protein
MFLSLTIILGVIYYRKEIVKFINKNKIINM